MFTNSASYGHRAHPMKTYEHYWHCSSWVSQDRYGEETPENFQANFIKLMLEHKGASKGLEILWTDSRAGLLGCCYKRGQSRLAHKSELFENGLFESGGLFEKGGLLFLAAASPGNSVWSCTVKARWRTAHYHHPERTHRGQTLIIFQCG